MSSSSLPEPSDVTREAIQSAAAWLARQDGGLTSDETQELDRWLAADPRHQAAWDHVRAGWNALDDFRHAGLAPEMVHELALRRRWRHRKAWSAMVALGAAACLLFVFFTQHRSGGVITRPFLKTLSDGTQVEMDGDAQFDTHFEPDRRLIRLRRGVALFKVVKKAGQPFIVSTGSVEVAVIGTAFSVQTGRGFVGVVVAEGSVSVRNASAPPHLVGGPTAANPDGTVIAGAGDQVVAALSAGEAPALKVKALSPEELAREFAWREPRVELSNTRLDAATALFNGENRVQLQVADPGLAGFRLSGVFRATDPEGFARLLEANYDIRVERTGDRIDLKSARSGP